MIIGGLGFLVPVFVKQMFAGGAIPFLPIILLPLTQYLSSL